MQHRPPHTARRWSGPALLGGLTLLCIGPIALISLPLGWPFSFGVPLFVQLFCFMALCYALARRSALYPDHPSYANTATAAVIARMEQTGKRMLTLDRIGAGLALIVGLVCMIAAEPNTPRERPALLASANTNLALACALLIHSATLVPWQAAEAYVRHAGTPATARILKLTNLGVGQRLQSYDAAQRYALELEVLPPTGAPYRVTLQQLVRRHPRGMPTVGTTIAVKYLPEDPQVVVVLLNPEDQQPAAP